ncbi:hepcidin-like [Pelobates fuscus]|uniref:hepcidin-like n=1 Tax=Pelobates fuscus TaxID=191477 RepID=UPI002FE4AC03
MTQKLFVAILLVALISLVAMEPEDAENKIEFDNAVYPQSGVSELPRIRRSVLGLCRFCCGCCRKMKGCGMCCRT